MDPTEPNTPGAAGIIPGVLLLSLRGMALSFARETVCAFKGRCWLQQCSGAPALLQAPQKQSPQLYKADRSSYEQFLQLGISSSCLPELYFSVVSFKNP